MNKKTKTILLIVIAILVWGYSALKWINYYQLSNDSETVESYAPVPQVSSLKLKPKNKKTLKLDYRDPFLNVSKKNRVQRNQNTISQQIFNNNQINKQKVLTPGKVVKWPKMVFSGVINNKLGLLKIEGKDYIVIEGDVKEDITINNITKEKIIVEFQGETKEIKSN